MCMVYRRRLQMGGTAAFVLASLISSTHAVAQTPNFTTEYESNGWQYNAIGLDKAIAKGLFGNGVMVGIADSAMRIGNGTTIAPHSEFAGRISAFQFPNPYDYAQGLTHGTNVASVVGGARDGIGMLGVASGSILSSMRVISNGRPTDPIEVRGPNPPPNAIRDSYAAAIAAGIRLFNNSYGSAGNVSTMSLEDATSGFDIETFRAAVNAGAVLVWASGNEPTAFSEGEPGLPFHFKDLEKGWVSVISVNQQLTRSASMSACGFTAQWCIAAPGENVNMATVPVGEATSQYERADGTSYSAPMVTGAIAIAKQMFPNASMQDLRVLVLQTATDIGDKGVDAIYGWGLLNIGNLVNATNPANGAVVTNTTAGQAAAVNSIIATAGNQLATARGAPPSTTQETAAAAPQPSTDVAAIWEASRMGLGGPIDRETGNYVLSQRAGAVRGPLAWGQGVAAQTTVDDTSTSPGARVNTAGALGGYELQLSREWRAGAAFGFTASNLNTTGNPDSSEARGYHGVLSAGWANGGWFADVITAVSWFDTNYTRTPLAAANAVGANQSGELDADSWGFGSSLKVGRTYRFDRVTLEPYLHASLTHLHNDSGVETGTGIFAISLQSGSYQSYEGGVGLRATLAAIVAGGIVVAPVVDVAYGIHGGDKAATATVDMLGTSIVSETAEFGRSVLDVSASLNISSPGSAVSGFIGYNGKVQEEVRDQSVSGGLVVRF